MLLSAPVDASGRFEVWIPGFSIDVNDTEIAADILLVAGSTEDGGVA